MIQVDHLCYHYKGGRPILRDVSFELDSGHFLAVLGNNGVGKSTLLKCINRILTADSGSCRVDGEDLLAADAALKSPLGVAQHGIAPVPLAAVYAMHNVRAALALVEGKVAPA